MTQFYAPKELVTGKYPWSIRTSSSFKPLGQSKSNFIWSILRNGEHVYINDPGHMTKMAAMAINSKTFKYPLQNQKAIGFETWHEALEGGALQSLYKS